MSLLMRNKAVMFKLESTYGVDSAPTGAANAIRASKVELSPMEGQNLERDLDEPHFGHTGTLPVDLHTKVTLDIELAGSGAAGTAPSYGSILRACRMAETIVAATSVTYNPISDGFESGTMYINIGGTLYKLLGARGNASIEVNASGIPYLKVELWGMFTVPTDQAKPTLDYSGFQKPRAASMTNTPVFTLDGNAFTMRSFKLDFGNDVEPQFLIGPIGAEEMLMADGQSMIETRVRATPMSTFNPYQLASTAGTLPVQLQHGTVAGNIVTIAAPKAEMGRPSIEDGQGRKEWQLTMPLLADAGNDDFTIAFT